MVRTISDESGFMIIDQTGNLFGQAESVCFTEVDQSGDLQGQNESVYFIKTVSLESARTIQSPEDAYQLEGQNAKELPLSDVREIRTNSKAGRVLISNPQGPIMAFNTQEGEAIHEAAKLIKQYKTGAWRIKSKRDFVNPLAGPVMIGLFLGFMLFSTWHYAVDIEAGKEVKPVSSFRHRKKSKLAIHIATALGRTGVEILAGGIGTGLSLWAIWGLIHADRKVVFTPKNQYQRA